MCMCHPSPNVRMCLRGHADGFATSHGKSITCQVELKQMALPELRAQWKQPSFPLPPLSTNYSHVTVRYNATTHT